VSGVVDRVLVALDATAETRAAIDTAVRLAARSKAPLHAVFVEEEDLLSVAGLSVARQIVLGAGTAPLTAAEVELHWRAAAARAHEDIRVAARGHGLEISFEVVRGAMETALAVASERDLVVAGAFARPVAGHFRVQSRWLAALELAPGPVLLAGGGGPNSGGVVALLPDRSAGSARLLRAAAPLAELGGGRLTLISPPALVAVQNFRKWITEQIDAPALQVRIEAAPADPMALPGRIVELGCRLLAMGAIETEGRLSEMTRRFACDLLVVR
jgi:nucleotide-binding universal stress UspA family protein